MRMSVRKAKRPVLAVFIFLLMNLPLHAKFVEKEYGPHISQTGTWRWPVVTIPKMAKEPLIDGNLDKSEWSRAAMLAPLMDFSEGIEAKSTTVIYLGYNDEKLFIGFRVSRPGSSSPMAEQHKGRDGNVWSDDCVELFLQPDLRKNEAFNFAGNSVSVFGDGISRTSTDKSWNAAWEYKASIASGKWEGEIAVRFSDLGVSPPADGTVWGFNFLNNQRTPAGELSSWSYLYQWNQKEDFGYLIFGGNMPAVHVLKAGETTESNIGCLVEISNFTSKDVKYLIGCDILEPGDKKTEYYKTLEGEADVFGGVTDATAKTPVKKAMEKLLPRYKILKHEEVPVQIKAGRSLTVPISVQAPAGPYVVRYLVSDSSGFVVAGGTLPFLKKVPLEINFKPYYLTSRCLGVTGDLSRVKDVSAGSTVQCEIADETGKIAYSVKETLQDGQQSFSIDVPSDSMKYGRQYVLVVTVKSADGRQLAQNSIPVEKPPVPEWFDNKLGFPEVPPEPWTPVNASERKISILGREILLGEELYPAGISSAGKEMLARPIALILNGSTVLTGASGKMTGSTPVEAKYSREGKVGNVTVKTLFEVEFDGFMRYDVTLTPTGGKAEVKQLVLEIPVKSSQATLYTRHALGTPAHFRSISSRYDANAVPEKLAIPFTNAFWLGNDERGLQWFCETDENWRPEDGKKAVEVVRSRDAVILRINFVTRATVLEKPVTYTWAMIPTPVKPMDKKLMRKVLICTGGFPEFKEDYFDKWREYIEEYLRIGTNAIICWSWAQTVWNPIFGNPCLYGADRIAAMKKCVDYAHEKGIKILVYAIWGSMTADRPEWKYFGQEMARNPEEYTLGNTLMYCPQSTFNDWYIYSLAQTIKETGIDGVYLDSSPIPAACSNMHHGCGYVDEKGKIHGTFPIFASRELHKRIYSLFHGMLKNKGIIYAHNTTPPYMATESFVDIHHTGEGSSLPQAQWRSRFYGYPYGLPVTFTYWNQPHYPMKRINAWAVALLLDAELKATSSMWPPGSPWIPKNTYNENAYIISKVWEIKRSFDWAHAEWWPYWKDNSYVDTRDPDVFCSFHLSRGNEAWLTVTNWKDENKTVRVRIDAAAMGFDVSRTAVRDIVTGENIPFRNGEVELRVFSKRPRLLHVTAARQ